MYSPAARVLVDVVRAVAVADIDVAVGCDRDIGRIVGRRLAVGRGLVLVDRRRSLDPPDDLSRQRRLDDDGLQFRLRTQSRVRRVDRKVQELGAVLLANEQSVRDAAELLPPRPNEASLFVENDHGIGALAVGIHGVVNVDLPLRVLDDSMRVAVFDLRWQCAPVMQGFVGEFPLAEDRRLRAGLVLHSQQNRRRQRSCCGRGKKLTSGRFHRDPLRRTNL